MRADSKQDLPLPITTARLTPIRTVSPARPSPRAPGPRRRDPLNLTFDGSKQRTPSSEPTSRRLMERLTELDRLHRTDQQRIKELELEVQSLQLDLQRLKTASQQALDQGSDIQSLYHELFLTDIKKQVDAVNREASTFRFKYEESRKELEGLRKENAQQKTLIRRYREFLGQLQGKQSAVLSTSSIEFSDTRKSSTHSLKTGLGKFILVEEAVKLLSTAKDMYALCTSILASTRKILPTSAISLYIADPVCNEIYSKGRQYQLYHYTLDNKVTITGHREKDNEPQEPLFHSIYEVMHGIRTRELLVVPIASGQRVLFILQCSDNNARNYTQMEEILLKLICEFAGLYVKLAEAKERAEEHKAHVGRITRLCTRLFAARSLHHFTTTLSTELPQFMEFEHAGVVFYDRHTQDFFTIPPESTIAFEAIRYPLNIGLTGDVFVSRSTTIVDLSSKMTRYNPDIDNASGAPEVRCMLLGCLVTQNGGVVGVIQVVNKAGHAKITEEDREKLNSLLPVLAGVIESCSEVLECLEVTTNVRKSIGQVQRTVAQADQMRSDLDTSVLLNHMAGIRTLVSEWSRKHV